MSIWIRFLKLEIVIEQDACRDDARFVCCKEASRAGLTADAVDEVVGRGLHRLFTNTDLILRREVCWMKSGTRKDGGKGVSLFEQIMKVGSNLVFLSVTLKLAKAFEAVSRLGMSRSS